jgi:magnesium transporter
MAYGPETLVEESVDDVEQIRALRAQHPYLWLNVIVLGTLPVLEQLGEEFGLHRLALEDALNIPQRAKFSDYGDHQFMVARMPTDTQHLDTEQLSVFLGPSFVITVQERPGDCLEPVRERLRAGRPRIRGNGSDYLVYTILDALVDSYFPVIEHVGVLLEQVDLEIQGKLEKHQPEQIHALKHELTTLRRYLWPLKDLNASLLKQDSTFLSEETKVYMRDCQDHTVHAIELVDSCREVASGLMDLYLSISGQRMNEVMKVLTIISTVFIPLSFIAGLYGMNFNPEVSAWNMPELNWVFGYPAALTVMALCAGAMLLFFARKGWFR